MPAQIRNEQAAIEFITAAAGAADDELDLPAGKELLDRVGARRQRTEGADRRRPAQRGDAEIPP